MHLRSSGSYKRHTRNASLRTVAPNSKRWYAGFPRLWKTPTHLNNCKYIYTCMLLFWSARLTLSSCQHSNPPIPNTIRIHLPSSPRRRQILHQRSRIRRPELDLLHPPAQQTPIHLSGTVIEQEEPIIRFPTSSHPPLSPTHCSSRTLPRSRISLDYRNTSIQYHLLRRLHRHPRYCRRRQYATNTNTRTSGNGKGKVQNRSR